MNWWMKTWSRKPTQAAQMRCWWIVIIYIIVLFIIHLGNKIIEGNPFLPLRILSSAGVYILQESWDNIGGIKIVPYGNSEKIKNSTFEKLYREENPKKALVASHFSQPKYMRFGDRTASYIYGLYEVLWGPMTNIGTIKLSLFVRGLRQSRGPVARYRPVFEFLYLYQGQKQTLPINILCKYRLQ